MIPYFGTPIGGAETVKITALKGAHAFVSYADTSDMKTVTKFCQSFAVDNGAFSFWKSGIKTDWKGYYSWVKDIKNHPRFDWAIIPDVIGGTEEENDALIDEWPFPWIGVPVWHMHESIERFVRLAEFPRVAIGGSGEFKIVGGRVWWERMNKAMYAILDRNGFPKTKIHGLRMLSPKIVERLPLSSADSTSIGRNINIDKQWADGRYAPLTKESRALILRQRTEFFCGAEKWKKVDLQDTLF